MNVFTKDPRTPEVIQALKKNGETVIEVTTKQLYVLHAGNEQTLEETMRDWFVKWRGRSHAYRDGSHVGGADEVVAIRNLTEGVDMPWPAQDNQPKTGERHKGRWKIEYENDTGASDDSFDEWWSVTDEDRSFRCGSEESATWLCRLLNNVAPDGFASRQLPWSAPVAQGYEEMRKEMESLPITWYPDLIRALVEAAYKKGVFVKGGATRFVESIDIKANRR